MASKKRREHRSAVTNGTRLHLAPIDARTAEGRRFADLVEALTAERGGQEAVDIVRQQAIRRYAQLAVECERMEAVRAAGNEIDAEAYGQLADRMNRLVPKMGAAAAPKRGTLADRIAARREAKP